MTISIVICTHNRCELLKKTLDTLVAMQVPPGLQWEVCVVDNHSTDATPEVVEHYARTYPAFPVRRVHEARPGVAFARNAGVESARGHIIAFVDDDVTVEPEWLSVIHAAFEADPELAILGGCLRGNPESPMPPWLVNINTAPLGLIDYGDKRRRIDFPYLATANCAFRKSVVVEAGMFDVRLGRTPTKLWMPWAHGVFSERTILRVRRLYRPNKPTDWRGVGLNQMTVKKFLALVAESRFVVSDLSFTPIRPLPEWLVKGRMFREWTTADTSVILTKPVN